MDSSEWAGRVGDVWAEEWQRTDRSLAPVDAELVSRATALWPDRAGLRVLDIGCGAGTTSLSLASRLPTARVIGVDLSDALIAVARDRASTVPGCRFEQGDAARWSGESGFDLLISRHGVMFFADPVSAFTHLRSLAREGGELVFSCFRSSDQNPWASALKSLMPEVASDPRAPGPFAFADQAYVADILGQAGWRERTARDLDFDYVAGGGDPVADAVSFFSRIGPAARALRELAGPARSRLQEGLEILVRNHLRGDRVVFPAAAWIWSARA